VVNSAVSISLRDSLLADIDTEARRQACSRSELLRRAARAYLGRQRRWDRVFALGDRQAERLGLTEANVRSAVRAVRSRKG
jgi:CopG family transcriptional regulator / antitoxin EndoAI